MNALRNSLRRAALALALLGGIGVAAACEPESAPAAEAEPDARLETHAIEASTPTEAGLSYLRAVADVHARADDADAAGDEAEAIEVLREGLALPAPEGLGEAEILRLELAARLGETLLPARAREARELLTEMLAPDRSLPLDRASAHALVVLGDAAVGEGDDALAVGSYARAIRMMSLLRQELKP